MKDKILRDLMESDGRKVFNMILRMVRNREDAEDLFQEVFTAFYQNLERVQPEAQKSYLYRIAYNKTLNRIGSRKRDLKLIEIQKIVPVVENEPDQEKRNQLIRESLRMLKPKDALLIELQFFQDKSYKEISEITGYSVGSVDSRLVRAKRKLRDILENLGINNVQDNQMEVVI
ncbi:MAG: sigma-70 family RNA polymerase sigma factor [Candidatus Cloacimonetes bacterium]|nr:sigma-70 family RNA polymerase sigma factor [Candidatus Cloacimonadota bacterium]